ncbi:MAG: hypothetical protein LBK99_20350 [Opitutaceae bacterium]|jgi:hypothetical protein|nr:hypothetical protein [Opitutaceae bacterium]
MKNKLHHNAQKLAAFLAFALAVAVTVIIASTAHAQVTLTGDGNYSQPFTPGEKGVNMLDTDITSPGYHTWTDNSSIAGWYAVVNGGTPAQYRSTTMGVTPTDVIYAARAKGPGFAFVSARSSTNTGFTAFGVRIANNTGKTITELAVSYLGQQWVWTNGGADALTFQYSLDATSLTTGTWTTVDALTFNSPLYSAVNGSGNTTSLVTNGALPPEMSTTLSSSITGLTLASGATIWFRWVDVNNTGVDQVLGIDDVSITSTFAAAPNVPEPSAWVPVAALTALALAGLRRWRGTGQS